MKVGVIGCGGIASIHIKVYQSLKNVEVLGSVIRIWIGLESCSKVQNRKTFTDYWDMFEKEDLDLVDICTPVSTNARIVCDTAMAVPALSTPSVFSPASA